MTSCCNAASLRHHLPPPSTAAYNPFFQHPHCLCVDRTVGSGRWRGQPPCRCLAYAMPAFSTRLPPTRPPLPMVSLTNIAQRTGTAWHAHNRALYRARHCCTHNARLAHSKARISCLSRARAHSVASLRARHRLRRCACSSSSWWALSSGQALPLYLCWQTWAGPWAGGGLMYHLSPGWRNICLGRRLQAGAGTGYILPCHIWDGSADHHWATLSPPPSGRGQRLTPLPLPRTPTTWDHYALLPWSLLVVCCLPTTHMEQCVTDICSTMVLGLFLCRASIPSVYMYTILPHLFACCLPTTFCSFITNAYLLPYRTATCVQCCLL